METRHDAGLWSESRHRVWCIGVMGGAFDPIHHGHLVAVLEVQAVFGLDEVVFVPTFMQPFKLGRAVTPAEHRYLMVVAAMASNPELSVPRVDIERGTTTYTIDALRDSHGIYQNSELSFITGADVIADVIEWKDVDKLFELAHLVGVTRPGVVFDLGSLLAQRISLVEIPAVVINSMDCRSRVKSHQPVWYLVLDGVVQYIAKYGLCQDPDSLVGSAKTVESCKNAGILKLREEAPE